MLATEFKHEPVCQPPKARQRRFGRLTISTVWGDPLHPRTWSGAPYNIATALRRLGVEVEGFSPRIGRGGRLLFAAQHLLDCPNEQLRAAGLSHNKSLALRDLAAKTLDGTVPTLARIRRMADEDIIEHLTQVRGIGRWTVEMLLIFRLGRPDVLPVSDYGVRKGFALTFGKLKPIDKVTPLDLPKPDEMHRRAKRWAPWRSVASWYMWRACDLANGKLVSSET